MPFIVMELLEGNDLGIALHRHGALAPGTVATIFVQACRGLDAAHGLGFVHRDVKPANLFLQELPSGEIVVKVCDFGIAKRVVTTGVEDTTADVTRTGGVLGSPMYMSPEQATDAKRVDLRTDVWSLGVAMYHALAGEPPWVGRSTVGELILAICTHPIPHIQDVAPWVPLGLAEATRPRRGRPALIVAALAAAAVAGAVLFGGALDERSLDEAPAASAPAGGSSRADTAPADPTAPAGQELEVTVIIEPASATVTVDGQARELAAGKLGLAGRPGQSFAIVVSQGDRSLPTTVIISEDGKAAPGRIELELPAMATTGASSPVGKPVVAKPGPSAPPPIAPPAHVTVPPSTAAPLAATPIKAKGDDATWE